MANKKKYWPAPTPERLHREKLEREANEPPLEPVEQVPWQVNAYIMAQMPEE